MFSALNQGSPIYLLDRTSDLQYFVGEVVGITSPKLSYTFGQPLNTVDLKIKVNDEIRDFIGIPSINTVVTYNNGKVIISETKQGIQNEVENIVNNSKSIVNSIDVHEKNIVKGEEILKLINPQFAREKETDERLSNLEDRFGSVETKLDKIFEKLTQK